MSLIDMIDPPVAAPLEADVRLMFAAVSTTAAAVSAAAATSMSATAAAATDRRNHPMRLRFWGDLYEPLGSVPVQNVSVYGTTLGFQGQANPGIAGDWGPPSNMV